MFDQEELRHYPELTEVVVRFEILLAWVVMFGGAWLGVV